MRIELFTDTRGQAYLGLDRAVGLSIRPPVQIHAGLPGFLGPEIIPPRVDAVLHRQVLSRARQAKKGRVPA